MNLELTCELSLSKKLRAIIKEGGNVTLKASNIKDGRGKALVVLTVNESDINSITDKLQGIIGSETSIIIKPINASSSEGTEPAEGYGEPVATIFSQKQISENRQDRSPIDRLAATIVPETKEAVSEAIKTKAEVGIPNAFKELKEQSCKDYIDNLTQLLAAATEAETKDSGIDPSKILDARKRAIAIEEKERAEAIDIPSYIVNTTCASLSINDLGVSLLLNVPFNLANISAKRLLASSDLKSMLRAKRIKFISPSEIKVYIKEASREEPSSLKTFDNCRQAEAAFEATSPSASEVEVSVDELGDPTEQEQILQQSGVGTARNTAVSLSGGVRTSSHSLNSPHLKRVVPQQSSENKQGIKTIRRA